MKRWTYCRAPGPKWGKHFYKPSKKSCSFGWKPPWCSAPVKPKRRKKEKKECGWEDGNNKPSTVLSSKSWPLEGSLHCPSGHWWALWLPCGGAWDLSPPGHSPGGPLEPRRCSPGGPLHSPGCCTPGRQGGSGGGGGVGGNSEGNYGVIMGELGRYQGGLKRE